MPQEAILYLLGHSLCVLWNSFDKCFKLIENVFYILIIINAIIGSIPVQADAFLIEIVHFLSAILQQRAYRDIDIADNIVRRAIQEKDRTCLLKYGNIFRPFDDTTATGNDDAFFIG